jgi:1,2-diacylglycerol 3-alpha-glucosyltransferase
MNIGIFTNNYLPNPYGVASSVESFRVQFEKLGHQVFIFAPRWKGYEDKNLNVFRYPSIDIEFKIKFPLAVPYSRKMDKIIAGLDLDIIHSQHHNLMGTAAKKWAKKKNIPLIFTWHTLFDHYAHFATVLPEKFAANWMIRGAVKYANFCDQVVMPTESVRTIIEKWGVTNKNIISIPTGVEKYLFENADGNKIRKKYNISSDDIVLFLNSRLTSEKNVEFLFHSVIKVLKKGKKTKILSIGDGDIREDLRKITQKAGVSGQVIFAGQVKKEEVKDYFAAGDIFVYASKSETQGMAVSEAMYMGLPIVAVKATGICDLVVDKINGFLVSEREDEFAGAVEKLISDAELRKKFGAESAKIAMEKYTDEICAQKMLEVYARVIAKK